MYDFIYEFLDWNLVEIKEIEVWSFRILFVFECNRVFVIRLKVYKVGCEV